MAVTGIEMAVERVVQKLASDPKVLRETKEAFLALLDQIVTQRVSANVAAPGASAAPGMLVEPAGPALSPLSDELAAGDPQYNARETMLRERLDLSAIERRLRASARSYGLEYHEGDLNGILRNAGYDAVHKGSSERYMAAIQTFIANAEDNYRQRASNTAGIRA